MRRAGGRTSTSRVSVNKTCRGVRVFGASWSRADQLMSNKYFPWCRTGGYVSIVGPREEVLSVTFDFRWSLFPSRTANCIY